MAKAKKGKKGKSGSAPKAKSAPAGDADAFLGGDLDLFAQGDYVAAAPALRRHAEDSSLSQGERDRAQALAEATRPERTALLVGLGCFGLMALVFFITMVLQP